MTEPVISPPSTTTFSYRSPSVTRPSPKPKRVAFFPNNSYLGVIPFVDATDSLIAIVFAAISMTNASVIRKITGIIIIIAGSLIMLLQLFTLI